MSGSSSATMTPVGGGGVVILVQPWPLGDKMVSYL